MSYCRDVLFITTLACQIADCLNDDELSILAEDGNAEITIGC